MENRKTEGDQKPKHDLLRVVCKEERDEDRRTAPLTTQNGQTGETTMFMLILMWLIHNKK